MTKFAERERKSVNNTLTKSMFCNQLTDYIDRIRQRCFAIDMSCRIILRCVHVAIYVTAMRVQFACTVRTNVLTATGRLQNNIASESTRLVTF